VRGPEGHLTKLSGNLWARTLFFLLSDHQNEMLCNFYQISLPPLLPFTGTYIGLAGQRAGSLPACRQVGFLLTPRLFHRDTKVHCHLSGLVTISQLHSDPKLAAVYRDWQKTRHRDTDGT
jgi:hypothetical protein